MNSQEKVELVNNLIMILIPIIFAILGLIAYLLFAHFKSKKNDDNTRQGHDSNSTKTNSVPSSNKQSVFKFMEFDEVSDNMIIQKNNTRFLMVIECQGINYDLMSGMEKTGVEEGFVQFLNSLRHKIQIYIQTRPINLESSLNVYSQKIKEIESKLNYMQIQYNQMLESEEYTDEQRKKAFFELTKQSNLYEYGLSVLQDTEKMSLNRSILSQKYYIIIPYFSAEAANDNLDKEEIRNVAFSELYTRAQSIIRAISVCDVRGKVLNSKELIELLYMAYNRDEAEVFGLDKALSAGYDEIYTTAPDVLKKKMRALDKEIEERALEKAREKVQEAKSELQKKVEQKEESLEDLIVQMAKIIIKQNEREIGKDVKEKAIEKIDEESTKEGGKGSEKKRTTRTRSKKSTI